MMSCLIGVVRPKASVSPEIYVNLTTLFRWVTQHERTRKYKFLQTKDGGFEHGSKELHQHGLI